MNKNNSTSTNKEELREQIYDKLKSDKRADTYVIPTRVMDTIVEFIQTEMAEAERRAVRGTPSECEDCGTTEAKRFEWANLTGNYQDVNDYRRLCTSCHNILDKKILNIKRMRYEATDELTDALKKLKKVK